jgi:twitching motility two-component system response regulator PilG
VKKKILVVDDSAPILALSTTMLKLLGYEPAGVTCGVDALKYLAHETPALVLLDVMLPDMDGFKICRHIKQSQATSAIPVFMVSAKKTTDDIERGVKAGADEYITKPFKSAEVAELINNYLGSKE